LLNGLRNCTTLRANPSLAWRSSIRFTYSTATGKSEPESAPAHYHREQHILYFVPRNGTPPWTSVARELALILCPDAEPGHLASAIKEVLAVDSSDQARSVLDELGFATLDDTRTTAVSEGGVVGDLGGEEVSSEEGPLVQPSPAPPGVETTTTGATDETHSGDSPTTESAIDILLGPDAPPPTNMPDGLVKPEFPSGAGGRRTGGTGSRRVSGRRGGSRRGYAVLRSYVMPDRPDDDSPSDEEAHARRSEVDQAGVDRVMEFEHRQDRNPREMPPKHPGYDVESTNADGIVERYIEVKSLSSDWNGADAGLTKPQFERAGELGDEYWLYVVERARLENYCIHCIQDPAGNANRFMFDPGWKQVAEVTDDQAPTGSNDE